MITPLIATSDWYLLKFAVTLGHFPSIIVANASGRTRTNRPIRTMGSFPSLISRRTERRLRFNYAGSLGGGEHLRRQAGGNLGGGHQCGSDERWCYFCEAQSRAA